MQTATRPRAYVEELHRLSSEALKHKHKLPITHGWYCRGTGNPNTPDWQPEVGMPSDVFVYLDMGDPYVREMYPDKGYFPLSEVTNRKAIANLSRDFAIVPPAFERLDLVMDKIRARRPEVTAALEEEIEEHEQKLADGGLPAGEPSQYRRKIRLLQKRLEMVQDDARFETWPIYEQMVRERQAVLESQQDPDIARVRALGEEFDAWEKHLEEGRASRDSTSSPASGGKSTRRGTASSEGSDSQ